MSSGAPGRGSFLESRHVPAVAALLAVLLALPSLAAVFLASDDSSFVTGIELFVDGGMAQV